VRGHTDSDPVVRPATLQKFPHGNLQLSAARAVEVASVLTASGGVPKDMVAVAGFGPYEPLVTNDSADNKRLNRRVEIFVAKGE
jgi:chemotaxis protein MotB